MERRSVAPSATCQALSLMKFKQHWSTYAQRWSELIDWLGHVYKSYFLNNSLQLNHTLSFKFCNGGKINLELRCWLYDCSLSANPTIFNVPTNWFSNSGIINSFIKCSTGRSIWINWLKMPVASHRAQVHVMHACWDTLAIRHWPAFGKLQQRLLARSGSYVRSLEMTLITADLYWSCVEQVNWILSNSLFNLHNSQGRIPTDIHFRTKRQVCLLEFGASR